MKNRMLDRIRRFEAGCKFTALRQDYRGMAVMIFGEPPPFEHIIEKLAAT